MIKQLIKKQRGVTLSMLLITIILVAILIGATVANLDMGNDIKKYNYMCADIELLESKVLTYYNENKSLPISSNELIDVTEITDFNPKDNAKYYEIDLSKLSNISLNLGKGNKENKDIYVINEQSHAIYYLKGVVYEGNTYHRPMEAQGGGTGPAKTLLPAEYQQVEYIESTGTQYIDTGWIPTVNAKIDLDIELRENEKTNVANGGVTIFSATASDDEYAFQVNFGSGAGESKKLFFWVDKSYGKGGSVYSQSFSTVTARSHLIFTSKSVSFQNINKTIAERTNSSSRNLLLLAKPAEEGILNTFDRYNAKIYSCKIYDGENLVRDFIPCYKKEGNVTGLYDIVNDVFYPNQGTGNFNVGPIKENIINASQGNLPSLYQQVEYIESTGTQYIDTGVQAYIDTAVEFKITRLSEQVTQYPQLFGAQQYDNGENRFGISREFLARTGSVSFGPTSITYDEPHEGRLEFDKYILDGITYTASSTWVNPGINMYLFNTNDATIPGRMNTASVARFYYFKIYDGDTLVRDFIPCYKKEDNVAGLYDLVNDVFYTNAGTGEFTVGANVGSTVTPPEEEQPDEELPETILPEDYQQVEYLESTGTQYIDTGLKGGLDTIGVDFKFNVNNTINNTKEYYILGNFNQVGHCGVMRDTNSNTDVVFRYYINDQFYGITIGLVNEDIVFSNKDSNITVNDDFKGTMPNNTRKLTNSNLCLYGTGIGQSFNASGKIYYLKIYEDLSQTNLRMNFIPCYRKSDNKPGLYDLVNDVFYTNAGTGEFDVGEDVKTVTILPEEYKRLQYIEGTGTQYIDTRTILNQDSVVEIDFEITEAGNYNVFGSRTSGEQNNIGIVFSNKYNEAYIDFQDYTVNRLVLSYNLNRNIYKISNKKLQSGDNVKEITSYTDFKTPENAYIFNISGGAPLYNRAKMKLYSCKIYNGATLIRDFIPCYRKADNVVGLYDLANDVFYTNAGTGTFTVGENV